MKKGVQIMKSVGACILVGVCVLSVVAKSSVADVPTAEELNLPVEISLSAQDRALLLEMEDDVPAPLRQKLRDVPDDVDGVEMTIGDLHKLLLGLMRQETRIAGQVDSTGRDRVMSPVLAERLDAIEDLSLRLHGLAADMDAPLAGSPLSYEIDEEFLRRLSRHGTDPGRVRLRIVDQEGNPVEGVGLTIERSYPNYLRADLRSDYEDVDIDGEHVFNLRRGMHSVTIYAVKDGYYRAQRYLRAPRKADIEERIMRDVLLGRPTELEAGDPHMIEVEMVLQKKGELVDLYQLLGAVLVRSDGGGRITRLRIPEGHPSARRIGRDQSTEEVEDLSVVGEWVDPETVSIHVAFDENGEIKDLVNYPEDSRNVYPRRLVLRMHDPEGGFVLHDPRREREETGQARIMLEAPENGYQPEVELTPQQQHEGVDFFFKNQGRYGKGRLAPIRLERGQNGVRETFINFEINPTPGDRNLETGK